MSGDVGNADFEIADLALDTVSYSERPVVLLVHVLTFLDSVVLEELDFLWVRERILHLKSCRSIFNVLEHVLVSLQGVVSTIFSTRSHSRLPVGILNVKLVFHFATSGVHNKSAGQ